MKSILLSVQPKWVEKILNGEKTIEIRKTIPKCELPIDVYIYCTKDKKYRYTVCEYQRGKVVAKFTLNKVSFFDSDYEDFVASVGKDFPYSTAENWLSILKFEDLITKKGCLTVEELWSYFEAGENDIGYAWHIDNLVIFDKPKELSEFKRWVSKTIYCGMDCPPYQDEVLTNITKAPQNYCYCEVEENV